MQPPLRTPATTLVVLLAGVWTSGTSALHGQSAAPDVARQQTAAVEHGQEWTSVLVGGLAKEVEVELYGSTRTTSPGALVVIRYSFNSYEDGDERVRLRLFLPEGWTLLDRDVEHREFVLEAWESVEGEIRVQVPRDARPGERHRIPVLGEVVGEPGGAAAYVTVHVLRRGGLQAGQVGLTGTSTLLATSIALDDMTGARYGGVVDLTGRLTRQTSLAISYRQGPRESSVTNYRIAQEETRWSGTLRGAGWTLQFGNQIGSSGNVITGPYVRGEGLNMRRTQGLLQGDLTVARPTSYIGDPGGHLVRASGGISGRRGRVALSFSDFGRPVGGYSTAPRYPEDIDPDSLERLERERKALQDAARNRVQGAGLDTELKMGSVHRVTLRGGWLRMHNAKGDTIADPSLEAQYTLNHRAATVNARWRSMPQSLQGVQLPGNEAALDGSLRIIGEWRLAARVYRTASHTVGNAHTAENEGATFGIRYYRNGWRGDLRGSYRQWSYGQQPTIARTITASLGMPLGPFAVGAFADLGEQENGTLRQPTATWRGDVRWSGSAGSASWSASRYATLNSAPRLRTDVLGSLKLGEWEVAGGAWATRGWKSGGEPGVWTQLGIPVSHDLLLSVGLEHAPPDYGRPPQWLGTLGVRRKLAFAIPFLRDSSLSRNPAGSADR